MARYLIMIFLFPIPENIAGLRSESWGPAICLSGRNWQSRDDLRGPGKIEDWAGRRDCSEISITSHVRLAISWLFWVIRSFSMWGKEKKLWEQDLQNKSFSNLSLHHVYYFIDFFASSHFLFSPFSSALIFYLIY